MEQIFFCILLVINLVAFIICGLDKRAARRSAWRIPEKTLLFLAVLGGSAGLYLGMRLFHHKTRKWQFSVVVPVLLVVQAAGLLYLKFILK